MSAITAREADKYRRIWAIEDYAEFSPGEQWIDTFVELVQAERLGRLAGSVLDVGCGQGRAAAALQAKGFEVAVTDLVISDDVRAVFDVDSEGAIWGRPTDPHARTYDYGYCCDVLEHIPTEFTMLAIDRIIRRCGKVFFSISVQPDQFGVRIGEPLHLTVQPFAWWRDRIRELARVHDARDCLHTALFWVEA